METQEVVVPIEEHTDKPIRVRVHESILPVWYMTVEVINEHVKNQMVTIVEDRSGVPHGADTLLGPDEFYIELGFPSDKIQHKFIQELFDFGMRFDEPKIKSPVVKEIYRKAAMRLQLIKKLEHS